MPLRTTIHSTLLAATGVTALIGTGTACRHYPVRAPQETALPYLVSQVIAAQAEQTHGLPTSAEDVLDEALVQFTAVAATPDAARALIAAVRAAFLDPTLAAPAAVLSAAGVVVTGPEEREGFDDDLEGATHQLDLTFFHNPQT